MNESRERLLQLLQERAYQSKEVTLSSSQHSNYYIDAKQVTLDPEGINLVGECFFNVLEPYRVDAVGGLTLGADPIATAVAGHSFRVGHSIPAFVARKDAKKHGLMKYIEGPFSRGLRVAIVDDVITTGRSVLEAVAQVESQGCTVEVIVALVDRQEGGSETFAKKGYKFESIFKRDDLTQPVANQKTRKAVTA